MHTRPVLGLHLNHHIAHAGRQHGDVPVHVAIERELLDHLGAVGLEAAVHVVEVESGREPRDGVVDQRRQRLSDGVEARILPAAHQVCFARLDGRDQAANLRGVVLQVAIHGHHVDAARMGETDAHGRRLAEVAAKLDRAKAGIALADGLLYLARPVAAPVVDEQALPRASEGLHRRGDFGCERVERLVLVVDCDDDGDGRPFLHRCAPLLLLRCAHSTLPLSPRTETAEVPRRPIPRPAKTPKAIAPSPSRNRQKKTRRKRRVSLTSRASIRRSRRQPSRRSRHQREASRWPRRCRGS